MLQSTCCPGGSDPWETLQGSPHRHHRNTRHLRPPPQPCRRRLGPGIVVYSDQRLSDRRASGSSAAASWCWAGAATWRASSGGERGEWEGGGRGGPHLVGERGEGEGGGRGGPHLVVPPSAPSVHRVFNEAVTAPSELWLYSTVPLEKREWLLQRVGVSGG